MKASLEISLYPLNEEYKPAIRAFIKRLDEHKDVDVIPNTMSTQVFGELDDIMPVLHKEIEKSWKEYGRSIFVCKFLKGDRRPDA